MCIENTTAWVMARRQEAAIRESSQGIQYALREYGLSGGRDDGVTESFAGQRRVVETYTVYKKFEWVWHLKAMERCHVLFRAIRSVYREFIDCAGAADFDDDSVTYHRIMEAVRKGNWFLTKGILQKLYDTASDANKPMLRVLLDGWDDYRLCVPYCECPRD